MGIRNKAYRVLGCLLVAAMLAGTVGCAIKPTVELPTPPAMAQETITATPTPVPTPIPTPTPAPTPDLTFRTADDLDNEEVLKHQAQLFIYKIYNSNVPYSDFFRKMDEETFINYLKWCNARKPNEEINLEAAELVRDLFLNAIVNEEVIIIWDILEGKKMPIENADFVGYANLMPTTSKAYDLAIKINKIKNELASFPSKERQLQIAQEALNISLDFMLSNDAPYNEENVKKYYMIEDDGRNTENSNIENSAFMMSISFELTILANMAYVIDPNLKPQYPSWHENYPDYLKVGDYHKKYINFVDNVYFQTAENMVKECENYVNNITPILTHSPISP